LLVTPANVDLDLIEERIAARDALEAHVRRLSMPHARVGVGVTRLGTPVDEDEWLETYRSLSNELARIERLIFAARGIAYPESFGARTTATRARMNPASLWAARLSGRVL
jgi:hypothetical protein